MTDWIVKLYRKMNTTARRVAVLLLAFVIAMSTLHFMTFPATALTRKAGENDPGIVIGDETNTEGFDNASEGDNTEVNPVNTETNPAEEETITVIPEGEAPAPADTTVDAEPTPEPTEATEPTATPDGNEEAAVIVEPTATPEVTPTPEPTEIPAAEEEPEEESDSSADVETAADWEDMFRDVELTGVWADDLLTLAELQKGYKESEKNFVKDDEGKKYGYTRYGEWYGDPYAEWDSLFVMFNLYYAGITKLDFPYQADCEEWIDALKDAEMFHEVNTYVPNKGDLVFADVDEDGESDHVAIVKAVEKDEAGNPDKLIVIEGNIDNEVKESTYEFYNPLITGFAQLPENPDFVEAGVSETNPQILTLTGRANGLEVTVEYEEGAFPNGTTMSVRTVRTQSVIDAISETVKESVAEENKGISKVQAVDIIFQDAEGNEIEPSRPIKVTMKSNAVPETADEKPVVVHVDEEVGPTVLETTTPEAELEDTKEAVSFEAGSFSVYAVVYTVDFTYEDKTLQFPGEGSYRLIDVLNALGIEGTVDEVTLTLVEGEEHDGALYLEFKDGEYWISSNIAFTDTYELTVQIGETIYNITVTDASYAMRDAVSSVSADGLSGSEWTVKQGEEYNIHISFEETPSVVQFPTTGNVLEYQLPNNFQPTGTLTELPVTLTYTEASVTRTIEGCKYSVDSNGKVTITLTDFAKEKLAESGDGKFNISIQGQFTENNEHTDFGGGNVKNIIVDTTKDVSINKTAQYNSEDNKVHYTVTVKADGSLTNVRVKDVISGSALTMNQDSITYNGNSSTPIGGPTSTGFEYIFPSMKNGETITINYTADVNWNEIGDGKGNVDQTKNTVTVKPEEEEIPEKEKSTDLENRISYNPLGKSGGTPQNTDDPDIKIVPWTITINSKGLKNMKDTTITDHNTSPNIMSYAGPGIAIEKFVVNADGSTTSQGTTNVTWDELGIDPESDASWSYKFTEDGKYKYVITYTTVVNVSGKNGYTNVTNNVEDDKGDHAYSGENVPPGSAAIGVDKKFVSADRENMTWTVTMDIPATGLNKAILIDTLPKSGNYQDTLNADSLNVTGLENGEDYVLSESKGKFTLTFYKDSEHTTPGLTATGRARQIKVSFTTNNDPAWVTDRRTDTHRNEVSFQGDNTTVYGSDNGVIPQTGIDKTAYGYKKIKVDGVDKIAFEYTLDLYGVTQDDLNAGLVVTDDYNETYMTFLDITGKNIEGVDTWWAQRFQNGYNGGTRMENPFVPQDENGILTFNIKESDLPKDGDSLYPRYQIRYYLIPNSDQLLNDSLSKEDRTIALKNTAKWGDSEDETTVDYSYPGLVKENVNPSGITDPNIKYDSEKGTTGFKITINPEKLELNGGNPMTLEDVFTDNLSVDYKSIKIVVEKPDDMSETPEVTYDYKGNTGIYIIPDRCKVTITYDARVIGNPGQWVQYENTATMKGFKDSSNGSARMEGDADGSFNIYSIRLYKYSAGHMEQPLEGATFTLVDANNNPIVYPDTATDVSKRGQPITFTTGEDGYVNISLNEQVDGLSLQKGITYYLKETVSPATHAINNTTYRFTISDNPNYSNFEYHSGDIMKVYDWPVMGRIEINKEIEGPSNLTEEDKQKIKFKIVGTYTDGTPIKVDAWGYTIDKADLAKYTAAELDALENFELEITYADFTNGKYTMADLVDGIYTVTETAAALPGYNNVATVNTTYKVNTDGSRVDDQETTGSTEAIVTITDHSKYVMNYKNTYSNRKTPSYDLVIKKVDANNNGKTLYGATFLLEKKIGDSYQAVTEGSVDADGHFTISYANKDTGVTLSALEPGEYRITEVKAPSNYKICGDGVIKFKVEQNGNVSEMIGDNVVDYQPDVSSDIVAGTLTIKNETKHSYTITKVDGANVSLKLPGAVFGVWKSSYPATVDVETAMKTDAEVTTDPLWTYETNTDGQFEIQKGDHNYEDGAIYFFKEVSAPKGYELPEKPTVNYFFFSYNGTAPTAMKPADLGSSSRSQTITNDLPNLEVKKIWKNLEGNNLNKDKIDVDSVDFVVYQKATVKKPDGTIVSESKEVRFPNENTEYTIEYVNGNWSTVSIPNAPAMGKTDDGNIIYYTYRVEEEVPEGWKAKVDFSESGREATITNTPEPMKITVKKKWNAPAALDPSTQSTFAQFQVYRDTDEGSELVVVNGVQTNTLNNSNNFEMTFEVEAGYTYHIKETAYQLKDKNSGFAVTYTVNGVTYDEDGSISEPGTVEIVNTYDEPYLEIQKEWDTEKEHGDFEIWVNIYRRNVSDNGSWELWLGEGKDEDKAKLDFRKNWKLMFTGEELQTDGKEYEYYVQEYKVSGGSVGWNNIVNDFYITYSSTRDKPLHNKGTITVTNSDKHDGELSVEKIWKAYNGDPLAEEKIPNTIEVILQRAEAVEIGNKVSLSVTLSNGQSKSAHVTVPDGSDVTFIFTGEFTYGCTWTGADVEIVNDKTRRVKLTNITSEQVINIVQNGGDGWNKLNELTVEEQFDNEKQLVTSFEDVPGSEQILTKPNWNYTWENLKTEAENGNIYVYNVREIKVNGKVPAKAGFIGVVSPESGTSKGTVTLTNTEIAKGSLKITKEVTVGGNLTSSTKADGTYSFRVTDSAGTKQIVKITIENGQSNTAVINDLPEGECVVEEIASTNSAVTMDFEPKTVTIIGGTSAESLNVAKVKVTNDYSANGSVPFKAKKIFEDHALEEGEFEFTLTEMANAAFIEIKQGGVSQTKTNNTDGDVVFKDINYTIADAGSDKDHPKEYYYVIKETRGTDPDLEYDSTEYHATVSVYDNGDGTLNVTKEVEPKTDAAEKIIPEGYDAQFINKEVEKVPFNFSKKWRNSTGDGFDEWPDGKEIEVSVKRRTDSSVGATVDPFFELKYGISKTNDQVTTTLKNGSVIPEQYDPDTLNLSVSVNNNEYKFSIGDVLEPKNNDGKEYKYFVEETGKAEGYSNVSYVMSDGNSRMQEDTDKAFNNETIVNNPDEGVILPKTGGPGTGIVTILGSILILTGAGVLLLRRRRESL